MSAAFLVRVLPVGDGPAMPPVHDADGDGIGFDDASLHHWNVAAEHRLDVTVWYPAGSVDRRLWSQSARGIAVVAGHLRRRGTTWTPRSKWAEEVWRAGPAAPTEQLHEVFQGVFAALCISAEGDGWITSDPFALRSVYVAEADGTLIVSSRAALAAREAASLGGRGVGAVRDVAGAAWLAAVDHHVGHGTGFVGVRVLAPGEAIRFRRGRPQRVTAPHPLAVDVGVAGDVAVRDAARVLLDDLGEALYAATTFPTARRVIELTGGKDSRLVLAAAIHAGVHHDFEYETVGPSGLADVEVAKQIAETFRLDHTVRFLGLRPPVPYADMATTFVERTGGVVNAWEAFHPSDADELRVTGTTGELLRAFYALPRACIDANDLAPMWGPERFDRLGLLRSDRSGAMHAELLGVLREEPTPDADLRVRLHAYYLGHRLRTARFGAAEEVAGRRLRFNPLYSAESVRLAMRLPGAERESGLLFAEAMRSVSEDLVALPFASAGWDDRAHEYLVASGSPVTREALGRSKPLRAAPEPAATLVEDLVEQTVDERHAFLTDAFEQAGPGLWSVLNPRAVEQALQAWPRLANQDRRLLYGAATAALWSSGPRA